MRKLIVLQGLRIMPTDKDGGDAVVSRELAIQARAGDKHMSPFKKEPSYRKACKVFARHVESPRLCGSLLSCLQDQDPCFHAVLDLT